MVLWPPFHPQWHFVRITSTSISSFLFCQYCIMRKILIIGYGVVGLWHLIVGICTSLFWFPHLDQGLNSNNLVWRLVEDEEPAKAVMDYLNQPLFKTVSFLSDISTTAEMHRMKLPLPLLILEGQVGKAEGAECQQSCCMATLSLSTALHRDKQELSTRLCPGDGAAAPPLWLWHCSATLGWGQVERAWERNATSSSGSRKSVGSSY